MRVEHKALLQNAHVKPLNKLPKEAKRRCAGGLAVSLKHGEGGTALVETLAQFRIVLIVLMVSPKSDGVNNATRSDNLQQCLQKNIKTPCINT